MAKSNNNLTASEVAMLKGMGFDPNPAQSGLTAAEAAMAQEDPATFARIKNTDTPPPQAMINVEKNPKGNPNPSGK